jgi:BTB/POZ domain
MNTKFSDITLVSGINATEFPAHKFVLATSSTFLDEYLKLNPAATKITLHKPNNPFKQVMKPEYLKKLMECVYIPNVTKEDVLKREITKDNCMAFYSLARSLEVTQITTILEKYITESLLEDSNSIAFYLDALIL